MPAAGNLSVRRAIFSLIVFGIAFGQVEAAVVVYLRTIGAPIRDSLGLPRFEPLPLFTAERLGTLHNLVYIELIREASTLIMLAAVAYAVSKNARSWLAAFSLAFGVWDLTFYLWLKIMIGWPASLGTWDILFLLPVPWAAPVAAPALVALSLAIGGAIALTRLPDSVPRTAWSLLMAGAIVLLVSFMWDWRHWVEGGAPRGFPWAIYDIGLLMGFAGFFVGVRPLGSATNQVFDGLRRTQQAGE
ncbi:MAG: hypothetical protein JO062_03975 [Bryobacterales bacterium]|nr:hypothetical protein [Bryobacterales bacterium]